VFITNHTLQIRTEKRNDCWFVADFKLQTTNYKLD
jgi:hypothetical protein